MLWIRLLLFVLVLSTSTRIVRAGEFAEIVRRGHLVVAVKDNLRPLGFRDQHGHLQGFEIDLARQLARGLLGDSTAVLLKPVANQKRLTALLSGEVDVAIANLTATENRRRIVTFSQPYYTSGTGLITQKPSLRNAQDLRTVAVLQQSHNISVIRSALPAAKLVGVRTYRDAKTSLETDKAEAFAGDQVVLAGWIQQHSQYRSLGPPIARRPLAIALPKGQQYNSLLEKINQSLEQLKQTRWLQQRLQYWGLRR